MTVDRAVCTGMGLVGQVIANQINPFGPDDIKNVLNQIQARTRYWGMREHENKKGFH